MAVVLGVLLSAIANNFCTFAIGSGSPHAMSHVLQRAANPRVAPRIRLRHPHDQAADLGEHTRTNHVNHGGRV